MPLSMARSGETVTIRKVTGKDEVRQHLPMSKTVQADRKDGERTYCAGV